MARNEFSHRSIGGAPRGRRTLFIATILVMAVFAADALSGGAIRGVVRNTGSGFWSALHAMRSSVSGSGFFARNSALAHENAQLKQELAQLRERGAAYAALKEENEALRAMLHLTQSSAGVSAAVVSSYHASPYGTFAIAAGRSDGIAPKDLALSDAGFVIGRVTDVGEKRTLVKNVFLAGSDLDVVVAGAAVTAHGEGGGNAKVTVPRGIDVHVGDAVTSPVLGGRPVGLVGKVEEISTSAEQKVYIAQPVNMALLKFVYIVPAP